MILGVDTGGTFTDFVLLVPPREAGAAVSLTTHKVLSTPDSPERAILQGISDLGLADAVAAGVVRIIHGSTVATNAALEGKGVLTAFVTNTGFRDLLTIARQTRPALYQLETAPITPPVPRDYCLEVKGRLDSQGNELVPLDKASLANLVQALDALKPRAVAISLLFSFLDPAHEQAVARTLQEHLEGSPFITLSSDVLPEYREYERGIATWLNASLGPLVSDYLLRLKNSTLPAPLSIMQSSGGTIDADQAARNAVNLLLSGPAGGLAAAAFLSKLTGQQRLMTFDMGGTSTDVAVLDGAIGLTTEGRIGKYPVAVPMVDMHTIGAGGGSMASIDAGNLLQVGPESAGARPGPACYGQGGTRPTVTDANLVLGRLQANAFLGGNMTLDGTAARAALGPVASALGLTLEEAAEGIIRVANEHMARALRVISVARGHDPAQFRLCCFGGAGGLHICALADAMGMTNAMVPIHGGVLSAMGMFLAPVERQLSRTYQTLFEALDITAVDAIFKELETDGRRQLEAEGVARQAITTRHSADLRYAGQSASLTLPWTTPLDTQARFHDLHEQRYGHRLPMPVELVNLRVSVQEKKVPPVFPAITRTAPATQPGTAAVHGFAEAVPVIARDTLAEGDTLQGPALIVETNATTWLAPDWHATLDRIGNLLLQKHA